MLAILVAVRTAGVEVAVGDGMGVGERVGVIEAMAGMVAVVTTEGTAVLAVLQPHASIMAMVKRKAVSCFILFSPCSYSNLGKKAKSFKPMSGKNILGIHLRFHQKHVYSDFYSAQSLAITSACSKTVCVAFSCLSGG